MTSENTKKQVGQKQKTASENTQPVLKGPRGRVPIELPKRYTRVLDDYTQALTNAPLSDQTRRTYASKVRQYLVWLASASTDGDPLKSKTGRDWAVRDYRTHLQAVLKRKPATVNNALAAIDDLYIRRGLGPAKAARAELPKSAPKALDKRAAIRFLRAVDACPSPRDRALALIPFYAGARITETISLDTDDVRISARKGILRIYGKGQKVREIPIHPHLRTALTGWLQERSSWPGAQDPPLFLNQRGARLSVKGAHDIITAIAETAKLDDQTTAHILRHTFATRLVRGGTDLIIVAELLGHARLETTRAYTHPTDQDRAKALELLDIDE